MKLAVVILNWNGETLLERFLPNVVKHSPQATIYLADNASTDGSIAYVKTHFPDIHIIRNRENGGFAKGYNDALPFVDADVFCLLNSDVEVTPDWLVPVQKKLAENPRVAILQPKVLDLLKKDHFEYAGAGGGYIDQLGYPFCRGRVFQTLEKDRGQYDDDREIFWATGACMFIRKAVFDELRGFDGDYFAHQEEVDLCWRAKNRGYQVWYTAQSTVYHLGGSTLSNMNPKKTFLNFRNSLFSITKNLPRRKALPIIALRLILDGVAAARFVLQFRFRHFLAILRAHFSFYAQFGRMYKKREKETFLKNSPPVKSIVLSYFVYRKKHFTDLVKD
ncbi:glycosyltransferase family 2 protein [Maribacter sp. 2307ULW6-5]|uniref:glycosyltransferase family 2 protein n=1 Tax=Maribacter sp. 2307ULW6-5 TaxID=3386275 RepID=UPI0039BC91FD